MTRVVAVAAAIAFVTGVVSLAIGGRGSDGDGGVRLVVPAGAEARLERPDEVRTVGPGRYPLASGDTVTAVSSAVRVELDGGAALELREGFRGSDPVAPDDTTVRVGRRPTLVAGELLAVAHDRDLTLTAAGTELRLAGGAARLHRSATLTVAVYEGEGTVASAGRSVPVGALRQAAVPGLGLVPGRPAPLVYDELDAWDRRYLGGAMDLTRVLEARAHGFTAQLERGEGRTVGFYTTLFQELDGEPVFASAVFRPARSPGEHLVGTAVALEGRGDDLGRRLQEVFAFREEGAEWGLVALDQDADRDRLLARLAAALDRSPLLFAGAPPEVRPSPGPGAGPGAGPGSDSPGPSTGGEQPGDPTTVQPPPSEPPGDGGTDNPLPPPLDEPTDPVFDLIGGLLPDDDGDGDGGGGGDEPESGGGLDPVLEPVLDPVTGLLDGEGATLGPAPEPLG